MYINQWELYEYQNFEPYNIITPLEAIIHESNANETYYHHNIDIPIWNNEFCMTTKTDSPFLLCQDSKDQPTTSFHQLGLECFMCSSDEDTISSSEKCSKFPKPICEQSQSPQQHKKVVETDSASNQKSLEISFHITQLESCTNQGKKSSPCVFDFATSCNSEYSKINSKGKRRLRWTKELHEPFIMIVNQLGGPQKAKPKAILQMMGLDRMLTISHVKSHLQKYRSTLHTHKTLKGTSEEGKKTDGINELQVKIQMQIEESRQLQLEVERSNQRQLEMQRNLQVVIEQQRKQLKLMLYQQKKRNKLENNLDS